MTDTHVALQSHHVAVVKNVTHQSIGFARKQLAANSGDYPRRILATVLQNGKRIIQREVYRRTADDPNYAAHCFARITVVDDLRSLHSFQKVCINLIQIIHAGIKCIV